MRNETNALSLSLARTLAEGHHGTFTGLVTRKVGVERGPAGAKVRYGDDLVHVVVVSGFKYIGLVQRSLERLEALDVNALVGEFAARGIVDGKGLSVGREAILTAIEDLRTSFMASLAGTSESTTDHVYDQLVVDGDPVLGSRVYKCVASDPQHECHCRACTGDEKAPQDGTIYLQGLKIGETVIEPAANGPAPESKSRGDVVAKNIIRARLPVGRYVSYRLEPGGDWILRVGGAAEDHASKDGVETKGDVVNEDVFALIG